jgi:hypothetical protein
MTVDAPNTGRATTRLNWLLRQLRDSKGQVCIEATAVRQRGKGAVRTLAEEIARELDVPGLAGCCF